VTRAREAEDRSLRPATGRRFAPVGYAIAAAVLALASSVVTLVFTLWPGLKPDPGERLGAAVSVFDVETAVTHGAWIRRTSWTATEAQSRLEAFIRRGGIPGERVDKSTRKRLIGLEGSVLYVRLTIEGFKRRNVVLRWSIYDARSGQRLPGREFHDVRTAGVSLSAPSDRSVVQVWVPPVPVDHKVFARIELLSRDGTLLAVTDSGNFRGIMDH
jgi:hypothetical protein